MAKTKGGGARAATDAPRKATVKTVLGKPNVEPPAKPRPAKKAARIVPRLNGRKHGVARSKARSNGVRSKAVPAPREVKIQALDPQRKCGMATSVVHLYRVDERQDGAMATHLVFFDKHGWYCEHGPNCHVVTDVRRMQEKLDRTIKVG